MSARPPSRSISTARTIRRPGRGLRAAALAAALLSGGCAMDGTTLLDQLRSSAANHHLNRGARMEQDERLDEALREFDQALRLNPRLATAHSKIAKIKRKRGQLAEAATHFAEALRLDPYDFFSALGLGQVYQLMADAAADRLEKLRLAARAYLHACDLKPEHFEAHLNLGVCYHQLGDLDQAIPFYQMALKIDPRNAFAQANLGAAYDSKGRYYDAIRAYKNALELGNQQPMVLVNLGTTYLKQNRLNAAMAAFQRAIELDRSLAIAYQRMGYCLYRKAQYDQALAAYGRSIQLNDKNAEAHAGRGVVLMTMFLKNKRLIALRDQALDHWHRSLEIDSNQPRLRSLLAKYAPPSRHRGQSFLLGQ